jgi:uncharacterized protein YcbK (DUF882 family)
MTQVSKNFQDHELWCKCCRQLPKPELIAKLQELRDAYGKPMVITSGYRCPNQNKKVGGAPNSKHVSGEAVDIACTDAAERYKLLRLAFTLGFGGIAYSKSFVHFDIRSPLSPATWSY